MVSGRAWFDEEAGEFVGDDDDGQIVADWLNWTTPDDERYVSSFDTKEEEAGER